VKKITAVFLCALSLLLTVFVVARAATARGVSICNEQDADLPVPGYLARTNSFPRRLRSAPTNAMPRCSIRIRNAGDGRAPIDRNSRSQQQSAARFSRHRLSDDYSTRQSYFIGLAFSSDGEHLYASMGSITDPTARSRRAPAMASRCTNSKRDKLLPNALSRLLRRSLPREGSCVWAADDTRRNRAAVSSWVRGVAGSEGRPVAHCQ